MAAVAIAIHRHKASEERKQQARQKEDRKNFVADVLKRYDISHSGGLKYNELKQFLLALHPTREDEITEGEVTVLVRTCTCTDIGKTLPTARSIGYATERAACSMA
jgi:hypothetical protein